MTFSLGHHSMVSRGALWHVEPMKTIAAENIQTRDSVVARLGWIALFAVLTGAGAWVRIPLPFTPVPITLQTMAVLASGIVLGRDGIYSQILYLVLGGIGLPMFASNLPNVMALFGPTGGYLIGFVAAAAVANLWVRPNWATLHYARRTVRLFAVSLLIFIPGVLQLALFSNLSISQAVFLGFLPFILGDLLKVLAVAGIPGRVLR